MDAFLWMSWQKRPQSAMNLNECDPCKENKCEKDVCLDFWRGSTLPTETLFNKIKTFCFVPETFFWHLNWIFCRSQRNDFVRTLWTYFLKFISSHLCNCDKTNRCHEVLHKNPDVNLFGVLSICWCWRLQVLSENSLKRSLMLCWFPKKISGNLLMPSGF